MWKILDFWGKLFLFEHPVISVICLWYVSFERQNKMLFASFVLIQKINDSLKIIEVVHFVYLFKNMKVNVMCHFSYD